VTKKDSGRKVSKKGENKKVQNERWQGSSDGESEHQPVEVEDSDDEDSEDGGESAGTANNVCLCCCFFVWWELERVTQEGRRGNKDTMKDLRLCGKVRTGGHPIKKGTIKGWYCKFCL
jgi:hypothetical protein